MNQIGFFVTWSPFYLPQDLLYLHEMPIAVICPFQILVESSDIEKLRILKQGPDPNESDNYSHFQFSFCHSVLESFQSSFLVDIPLMHSMIGNLID